MKKFFIFSLLSLFLVTTACKGRDVFLGALGVGLGLGLIKQHHNRHHHDRGRHHRDRHHHRHYAVDLEQMAANSDAQKFADKHQVSYDAAKKIQKAFVGLSKNGLASFASIGLNKGDLKALAKHDLPDSSSIRKMADKLDMSEAQTRDLLQSMDRDFSAQASNVNSGYWKSCTRDGQWKTPQSSSCTSLNARGCSPSTGASMCY